MPLRRISTAKLSLVFACAALAGCNLTGSGAGTGPAAPPPSASAAATVDAPIGGPLGASLGAKLDDRDRQAALAAEIDAVTSGQRRTWRGSRAYGYVDPGSETASADGPCRQYTQTVYVGGHPQKGNGLACPGPDGAWRIVN